MIIKKWNGSQFDELYPKTKASEIYASNGTTSIFDAETKIKPAYLPDYVFGGLQFSNTISGTSDGNGNFIVNVTSDVYPSNSSQQSFWQQDGPPDDRFRGNYWVATRKIYLDITTGGNDVEIFIENASDWQEADDTPFTNPIKMEAGDWLVYSGINLQGETGTAVYYFSIVNNTYDSASTTTLGVVKLGSNTAQTVAANAVSSTSSRTYAIQNNGSGQLVVNVPWSDTNTTYSEATTTVRGLIELTYAKQTSAQTVQSSTTTAGRWYGLTLNQNGQAIVNVPWTDTNTTYSTATSSSLGLVKIGYTENGKNYPVELASGQMYVNVPWSDNNTTYSAGEQITLTGTTFSQTHPVYVQASAPTTTNTSTIWFDI